MDLHREMGQPDRRRIEGRSQPVQQVDPEEHLVHAAADQNVEARQQARQVQVQPGFRSILKCAARMPAVVTMTAAIASQCGKKKMRRR